MLLLFIPTHVRSLMLLSQIAQFLHDITGLRSKLTAVFLSHLHQLKVKVVSNFYPQSPQIDKN